MKKPDPLAAAIDAAQPSLMGGNQGAVERLFGDRPDVLASIQAAHARGITKTEIARLLTAGAPEGVRITDGQVKSWIDKHAPKTLS